MDVLKSLKKSLEYAECYVQFLKNEIAEYENNRDILTVKEAFVHAVKLYDRYCNDPKGRNCRTFEAWLSNNDPVDRDLYKHTTGDRVR